MFNSLNKFINFHFKISFFFLVLGLSFGVLFSLQLLNIGGDLICADTTRSLHISLMLYGFVPLMLSLLPFTLFDKDRLSSQKGLQNLNRYFILWYVFLIFMTFSLLFGVNRNLAFYDFDYKLNFILAFAGIFYIMAIFNFLREYGITPVWVKISKYILFLAPIALLILMNPTIGQVEKSPYGPHGDNTLGMSFALIPIFYLIIKSLSKEKLELKLNFLWIIPLFFYLISVLKRSFVGELTYNEEWFYQWLTLLYIPLLLMWLKDSKLKYSENSHIFISIYAFLFVDIEGNILFIPEIREAFHRNDLVVGHAHIAVAISVFFMAFATISKYIDIKAYFFKHWSILIGFMALVLSLAGFNEANIIDFNVETMWLLRSLSGISGVILILFAFSHLFKFEIKKLTYLQIYNLVGFLSDGVGGLLLLLFGDFLYSLIGFEFLGGYQYIVFGFVMSVGIIHLIGFIKTNLSFEIALITSIARVITAGLFYSLFMSEFLNISAILIAIYDITFALIFLLTFKKESFYEKNSN